MKTLICLSLIVALAMAGGVHRVAQSGWDCPNEGHNTELNLYLALDSGLNEDGVLKIGIPSGASDFAPTTCWTWELVDGLEYPGDDDEDVTEGTLEADAPAYYCTPGVALSSSNIYGVHLGDNSGSLAEGVYAPVTV